MSFNIKNKFNDKYKVWIDILEKVYKKYNLNINLNFYFNLKQSDGQKYMKSETKDLCVFFAGSKNNYDNNFNYQFITINTLNPNIGNLNNSIKYDDIHFKYISSKMIPFNKNYQFNNDKYILVLLNNYDGWFRHYYNDFSNDNTSTINNLIKKLIVNIRKYSNNKLLTPKIDILKYQKAIDNILI